MAPDNQEYFKKTCPELKGLPEGWIIRVTGEDHHDPFRVYFQKGAITTFDHPTLGPLPSPWILRLCGKGPRKEDRQAKYFNTQNHQSTDEDPRLCLETLDERSLTLKNSKLYLAGGLRRYKRGTGLEGYKRQPIGTKDIRDDYEILKAIDPGDGSVGGMNGGVFVVRLKNQHRLSVEKRFKRDDVAFGQKEIKMLHRLRHASLTMYTAGFITPDLRKASVYVEFCDRGSLDDLIKNYRNHRNDNPLPLPPERFVWNVFIGLLDGLAYLQRGKGYASDTITDFSRAPGWIPILHRDIKPDNVLLRSRDTIGSTRYFYCVLSDFGLACEDRPDHDPEADRHQKARSKLGTKAFWAPELLYNPYPKKKPWGPSPDKEFNYFPDGSRHSTQSDLWALGACMYNLVSCRGSGRIDGPYAHMKFEDKPPNVELGIFMEGTASRMQEFSKFESRYSKYLREGIHDAGLWEPHKRPTVLQLLIRLKKLCKLAGMWNIFPQSEDEKLPAWATRVHDYHSRPPLDASKFNN